jgi:hypothetical protein
MYHTSLYRIQSNTLSKLKKTSLGAREALLQEWIWKDPSLLGEPMALIGREVLTDQGKRIDLLAIDEQQNICVIELKRDKTPREVVAQALDYASWISETDWARLDAISMEAFSRTVGQRYTERFGNALDTDVSPEPRMIIVASQLDEASERIARFLTDRGISINAIFFSAFEDGEEQLLARSWLIDPEEAEQRTTQATKKVAVHPHSGYWFVNVGATNDSEDNRSWSDNRRFGFMSAGNGPKYAKLISNVVEGEYVYAYLNRSGYVGFGKVISAAVPIAQFRRPDGTLLPADRLENPHVFDKADDLENCEYAIGVDWIATRDANDGIKAPWHSVMTACALNQPLTLAFLESAFGRTDDNSSPKVA